MQGIQNEAIPLVVYSGPLNSLNLTSNKFTDTGSHGQCMQMKYYLSVDLPM